MSKIFSVTFLGFVFACAIDRSFAAAAAASSAPPGEAAQYFVHIAVEGDTLIALANRYLVKRHQWQPLQKLNKVADPKRIRPGTPIRIPLADMRTDMAAATVQAITGPVESTAGRLVVGSPLGEGAGIKTGENGFVTLRLADGSTLVVQSKSQARLDVARTVSNSGGVPLTRIGLASGRVEADVVKRSGAVGRFEISTPTANLGVRGTQFRVSADENAKSARGEVVEGVVNVAASAAGEAALDVKAGYGTVVEAGKAPMPAVRLLAAPDLSTAPVLQERILLRFPFSPVPGAAGYRAQVAADNGFTQLRAEGTFSSAEAKFGDLADAGYFLRVRAIDALGIEGSDAVLPFKLKARPEAPFTSAPLNKDKFAATSVRFSWANATEAATYRLQLAPAADFRVPILDERNIKGNGFEPGITVKPGDYYWRVASVRVDGDQGPFGDVQAFTVKPIPAAPNPPKEEGGRVRFSWGSEPGQKFEFQLARDAQFAQRVSELKLDHPEVTIDKPGESGLYYMRYRAIDADGFIGPYSSAQTIEVKPGYWWLLLLLLIPVAM
jgi:hypothetical protein